MRGGGVRACELLRLHMRQGRRADKKTPPEGGVKYFR
jgi:hypothetical protein